MKSIVKGLAAAAAGLAIASAPAWAQSEKAAAKDGKASPVAHKSRRHEDARACLERASDAEVIKCAEAYL